MSSIQLVIADPKVFEFVLFLISITAGFLGSILGLGGGIVIVPVLTLFFGIHIKYAVGASIVSIIATSSGAAIAYVKDRIANIRVAMVLEMATTMGALSGALLAPYIPVPALFFAFSIILFYSAVSMMKGPKSVSRTPDTKAIPDKWGQKLRLNSSYPDALLGQEVHYSVRNVPTGFSLMYGAGVISSLLGIGSGSLKVPAMDRAMGLPIKVSSATSNFMIGVTGAASAGTYFMRGDIIPVLAGPVALGVLVGATFGTKVMVRLPNQLIRRVFVFVLVGISIQMALKGLSNGAS